MKNYTSSVPAAQSVELIEVALIRAGAKHISKEYDDKAEVKALSFMIPCPETKMPLGIRLPANPDAVYLVLKSQKPRWQKRMEDRMREQAKRTAWKLIYDWVLVQLSLIEMKQVEMLQVFLPYVWSGQATFYEGIKANGFKALGYTPQPDEEAEESTTA